METLMSPIAVGNIVIPNRIYVSSHTYGFVRDGRPTADFSAYVDRRLRGGAGLVVLGETLVSPDLAWGAKLWGEAVSGPWLERFYRGVAETAAENGAHVFDQLFHPGGQVWQTSGAAAFAPSRVHHSVSGLIPWEMSRAQLAEIVAAFAAGATRALAGGLAGIEIKADQGKLHHQFLSPTFNRRSDDYGGNAPSRGRLLRETLEAVREAVGDDIVVGVRLPTADTAAQAEPKTGLPCWMEDVLAELEAGGNIDYVALSKGTNSTRSGYRLGHADETLPAANALEAARDVRDLCQLPLFLSSNIRRPEEAVYVLASGAADMVAMTRAHIADPEIVNKLTGVTAGEIRPCIACNQGCVGNAWVGRPVRCAVNPESGRERHATTGRLARVRRVAVIGAGPAGLEAAIRLAAAGAEVTLFEQSGQVGGQLRLMGLLKGRREVSRLIAYFERTISDCPSITLQLNRAATAEATLALGFDRVVLATGSSPVAPWSVGVRQAEACDGTVRWFSPEELIADVEPDQGPFVVADYDQTQCGLGVAAHLVEAGATVTYLTPFDVPGGELDFVSQSMWLGALRRHGATVLTGFELIAAADHMLHVYDVVADETRTLEPVASVVGVITRESVVGSSSSSVHVIGDARFPRGLEYALADAMRLAKALSSRKPETERTIAQSWT